MMEQLGQMSGAQIVSEVPRTLAIGDEHLINIHEIVWIIRTRIRCRCMDIHETETQIGSEIFSMRFAPFSLCIQERRYTALKFGVRTPQRRELLQILTELLMDRVSEHRFLGGEVVVQRALGDIGLGSNLLHGDSVEPIALEQSPCNRGKMT